MENDVFLWTCMRCQLLTREFVPPKSNHFVKIVSQLVLNLTPTGKRASQRNKDLLYIKSFEDKDTLRIAIETLDSMRVLYPSDLMDSFTECIFEGYTFPIVSKWDEYLKRKFGDYMILPPQSERTWKHHPILLDFNHSLNGL